MQLILTRHGQTDWNLEHRTQGRTDIPLNDMGKMQAQCLAQRLRKRKIDVIYTSPLLRARQTAQIVADACGAVVVPEDALLERQFGIWEGMCFADIVQQYPEDLDIWEHGPDVHLIEGAEKLDDMLERAQMFYSQIKRKHKQEDTLLLVSHSITVRLMIADLIGLPIKYIHNLYLDNCSYTVMDCSDMEKSRRNRLLALNDVSHLRMEQ